MYSSLRMIYEMLIIQAVKKTEIEPQELLLAE